MTRKINKEQQLLEMLKQDGEVEYFDTARKLRIRNFPHAIHSLRKQGHDIATVMALGNGGVRYAEKYVYKGEVGA